MPKCGRMHVRLAAAALVLGCSVGLLPDIPAVPIPQDPTARVDVFEGRAWRPRPLRTFPVPRHPFMAPNGRSNIHADAYQTDAHAAMGPLGRDVQSRSTFHAADCASVAFDRAGRVMTICVGLEGPRLTMIDPGTLATKAVLPLPPRSPSGTGDSPFTDFAGGGYFYLDHEDRVVVPTTTREIWIVAIEEGALGPTFVPQERYSLLGHAGPDEGVVSVLPDWSGNLWFVTTRGGVGFVEPGTGVVTSLRLRDETISNSFAVDDSGGVFVVSDTALYRFEARGGEVATVWRETYERGERRKPGQVNLGSGTTPTVIGDDLVAIADNADPRMHLLVYRRGARVAGERLVCSEPVFGPGEGATDQSLIAVGRSLITENNYGYTGPGSTLDGATTTPG